MSDHNNRLFHYIGFKDLVWIPEKTLDQIPTSDKVSYSPGSVFKQQHAEHKTWSLGIYYPTSRHHLLEIKWVRVIVIKDKTHGN